MTYIKNIQKSKKLKCIFYICCITAKIQLKNKIKAQEI